MPARALALLLVLLVSSAGSGAAQPFPARAELKSGQVLEVRVTSVTDWGFWLESGQGLLFRQLRHIQTASDTLRNAIVECLPDVRVEEQGTYRTIRFDHLVLPPRMPVEHRALRQFAVRVGPSLGSRVGVETAFDVQTRLTGPLVIQVGHQIGWRPSGEGFRGGFALGVGVELPLGRHRFRLLVDAWQTYLQNENERRTVSRETIASLAPDAYSVTMLGQWALSWPGYRLQAGFRSFPRDVAMKRRESPLGVLLALSWTP